MSRIRILFEKRGFFVFVNHMDLPVVFSRAARRAGLVQEFTQGFSPHPRISLAPPLAIGVEGLAEPADFWFDEWDENSSERWSSALPDGLKILKWAEADGVSLAKLAQTALYRVRGASSQFGEREAAVLADEAGRIDALLDCRVEDGAVMLAVRDLEHCGAGLFVKALASAGIVSGWGGLRMERLAVGLWNEDKRSVVPLI
ncbi:TIGR03936 family radical SAM-associated protein [Cloacibacillus sp. An23]|uniref:TIGR03936 family radical SAM-associated protein n=1 Tax=Cloacibacillus sp. An23 TaxID=1965591 RepID=UPI000B372A70|nr:TIGR03936 family radical SAM-associated protein [Cloacibacillus sp. An23]